MEFWFWFDLTNLVCREEGAEELQPVAGREAAAVLMPSWISPRSERLYPPGIAAFVSSSLKGQGSGVDPHLASITVVRGGGGRTRTRDCIRGVGHGRSCCRRSGDYGRAPRRGCLAVWWLGVKLQQRFRRNGRVRRSGDVIGEEKTIAINGDEWSMFYPEISPSMPP